MGALLESGLVGNIGLKHSKSYQRRHNQQMGQLRFLRWT